MRKFVWQKETAALQCPQGFLLHPGGEHDDDDDQYDNDDHDDLDDDNLDHHNLVALLCPQGFLLHPGGGDVDHDIYDIGAKKYGILVNLPGTPLPPDIFSG